MHIFICIHKSFHLQFCQFTLLQFCQFYILQAVTETTIGNSNPALWPHVQPKGGVLEWMRVLAAIRLATSGKEWTNIFKKFNSGT